MSYSITQESFENLASYHDNSSHILNWSSIFILPTWLKTWWQEFGSGADMYLGAVRRGEKIIGIAPLLVQGDKTSIIGSADVCDYLDFMVVSGMENDFFNILLDDLRGKGINSLDLKPLRPDSMIFTKLLDIARDRKYEVLCHEVGVSVELDLPPTWEEYLAILTAKQRHEVRRKLRRLWEVRDVNYHYLEDIHEIGDYLDVFFKLFSLSHEEKASFMTDQMKSFFRSLAEAMSEIGLLRFGILELEGQPTAMIMGFDYSDCIYLYNSAYDPNYSYLSVGLLSKVLGIKESIQRGRVKWDFLGGGELYKYHLGGRGIPLYHCQINIK